MAKFLFILLLLTALPAQAEIMRVSAVTAPGTPWHDSWLHLQSRLDEKPDLFDPRFYLGGQLGSEESALSQLRRGRIQMGGFSLQGASSVVPELGVLMSPYLFTSFEEVDFAMDHYLLQSFDELFAAKGLVLLSWAEVGWTSVYGSAPIHTPSQAHGLKLRSSNALASQVFVRSIGADMVPLTFADIMPSLQTGLIQGGESGAIFYALTGLPGEAPYLTLTRHAFDTGMYLANREWFEDLPLESRKHLRSSLMPSAEFRLLVRNYEQAILQSPERYEINLYQPTADQLQQWKQATAANRAALIDQIGGESHQITERVEAAKAAFREQTGTLASAGL